MNRIIKSEPVDTSQHQISSNSNEAYQQELINTNGRSSLVTSSSGASLIESQLSSTETAPTDIEKRIIELCKQHPDGISDKELQIGLPNISAQQRIAAMNRLSSSGKIDLMKSSKHGIMIRIKDLDAFDAAFKSSDSSEEEKLIYTIIKESGNKGIWVRDITIKTNLKGTVLNKILKSLESKKLIKAVTSINAIKKKVYMLFDLEPDRSLTGGSFYNGKEFESEFVEILNEQCHLYLLNKKTKVIEKFNGTTNSKRTQTDPLAIRNASYATGKEIRDYIKNLGISKVELNVEDIEQILNTLVYDGKVERTVMHSMGAASKSNEHVNLYFAVNSLIPAYNPNEEAEEDAKDDIQAASSEINQNNKRINANDAAIAKRIKGYGSSFVRVPCGICPVIDKCHEDGPISPKNCVYMKEWLEF